MRAHRTSPGRALVAVKAQAQRLQFGPDLPIDIGGEARAARVVAPGGAVDPDGRGLRGVLGHVGKAIGAGEIADSRREQGGEPGEGAVGPRAGARRRCGVERGARLDQFGDRAFQRVAFVRHGHVPILMRPDDRKTGIGDRG